MDSSEGSDGSEGMAGMAGMAGTAGVGGRDGAPLPVVVVRWVEARLHATVDRAVTVARLYGWELLDPAAFVHPDVGDRAGCAARMSFVGEHVDASELVLGAAVRGVDRFDGLALSSTRWQPVLRDDASAAAGAEGRHCSARVTVVVGESGTATAVRLDHRPDRLIVAPGLAAGGAAGLRLAAVWAASPAARRVRTFGAHRHSA